MLKDAGHIWCRIRGGMVMVMACVTCCPLSKIDINSVSDPGQHPSICIVGTIACLLKHFVRRVKLSGTVQLEVLCTGRTSGPITGSPTIRGLWKAREPKVHAQLRHTTEAAFAVSSDVHSRVVVLGRKGATAWTVHKICTCTM